MGLNGGSMTKKRRYLSCSLLSASIQMKQQDQQQKFLPSHLLEGDDLPETKSLHSDRDSERMVAFSAPPILFDIKARFYEDFLEEITQNDPELDRYGLIKTFNRREETAPAPINGYRKFSLQTEEYSSYCAVHVPTPQYYPAPTPEEDILNNLDQAARWARDQYGSRAVQSIIEEGESYAKNFVFESLIQESIELTKDKFGNYVFQKIFERGEEEHRLRLLGVIKANILSFSENCYGCRVVQKAIEFTRERPELQRELVGLIEPFSLYLVENINGNHVMQKCFEIIDLGYLTRIIELISLNYKQLSLHAYGCRVIQKYLERLHAEWTSRQDKLVKCGQSKRIAELQLEIGEIKQSEKIIFDKLLGISVELSQCQYGNYVMQHIVANSREYRPVIEDIFLKNLISLSCNKYGSNVIEKVIKLASQEYREKLGKTLRESDRLVSLARHQFGNYVIQSLMQKMSQQGKLNLKGKLRENAQEISKSQYGRHVLMQLDKIK